MATLGHCWRLPAHLIHRLGALAAGIATQAVRATAALILFVAVTALSGPVPLEALAPAVARALAQQAGAAAVTIGGMSLDLRQTAGTGGGPVLRVRALTVVPDAVGAAPLTLREAAITLDGRALLEGRIAPVGIGLIGPDLTLVRSTAGAMSLALRPAADPTPRGPVAGEGDPLAVLDRAGLAALDRVTLTEGTLTLIDRRSGHTLVLPRINLSLRRDAGARTLSLSGVVRVLLGQHQATLSLQALWPLPAAAGTAPGAPPKAPPAAAARPAVAMEGGWLTLAARGLQVAQLVDLVPDLRPALASTIQADAALMARFDRAGGLQEATLDLATTAGDLVLAEPALGPTPLRLTLAPKRLLLRHDAASGRLGLAQTRLGVAGVAVDATVELLPLAGGGRRLSLDIAVPLLDRPQLEALWPAAVAVSARQWVLAHIPAGSVRNLTAALRLRLPGDGSGVVLEHLAGTAQAEAVTIDYRPPMPPLRDAWAQLVFDHQRLHIDGRRGLLAGATVAEGTAATITGLDVTEQRLRLEASLAGPAEGLVRVLQAEPIAIGTRAGLPLADLRGRHRTALTLDLPLSGEVGWDRVGLEAKVALSALTLPEVAPGVALSDGALDLLVRQETVEATGTVRLNGHWLAVEARRPLRDDQADAHLTLSGAVPPDWLAEAGLGAHVAGPVSARVTLDPVRPDRPWRLLADLGAAQVSLPAAALDKPRGVAMTLAAQVQRSRGPDSAPTWQLSQVVLDSPVVQARAQLDLAAEGGGFTLALTRLTTPRGDDLAGMVARGRDGAVTASITGRRLNLAALRDPRAPPRVDLSRLDPPWPLSLDARLARLDLEEEVALRDVRIAWSAAPGASAAGAAAQSELDLTARIGRAPLTISYRGSAQGRRLEAETTEAGRFLRALGATRNIRGGDLRLVARQGPGTGAGGPQLSGRLWLLDFRAQNTPVLARLLASLSLDGLLGLLTGAEGLSFDRFAVNFTLDANSLTLQDGRTSGNALGMTVAGRYDRISGQLAMSGTVVPASTVNQVLGAVPLLGTLLTGLDGGGVFAARYTLQGTIDDPAVSINPLSALAPGIVRDIFFLDPQNRPIDPTETQEASDWRYMEREGR